ncbi:putative c2h2 transcription factor [Erysiphe neolycopersici]|uniref:Putative c2h2 transcription factor n=1 Tax=Erysiphe neolycopersici TaxID=212602 RepID=A0A420HKH0_9PEZI|nr:putative c2h2 transcription factor [Erysiphe neolycopersici]
MCCVDTQPCNAIFQDIGTGSESQLIQRTRLSHSVFPDKPKSQYSPMKLKHNANLQISTSMFEANQMGSDLSYHNVSPDSINSFEMLDLVSSESIQDNIPLKLNSDTWNCNISQFDNTGTVHFPSEDSVLFSLSNSFSSNDSVCMLSGNFDNGTNFNKTDFQNTISPIDGPNFENFHYPEGNSRCQKNSNLFNGPHDMSNIPLDDFLLGMKHGINLSSSPTFYEPTSISDQSLWDDLSSASSPEILPRYDEIGLSPIMSNSICFSSSAQVSSPRGTENYADLDEKPDHSLLDDTDRMDARLSPFGTKDIITSEHSSIIGFNTSSIDDTFKTLKRSTIDSENVRTHPLYHNAVPQEDGLYHCPWENESGSNCQHKPEKLKCNYDKCVDSHLKPYQCKVASCKGLSFSSTACLLRHEREAHAMHGHGDKPFLCPFEGCDRGIPGKGFPRRWNLCDHIRRVHKDPISSPTQNSENSEYSVELNASGITESTNCTKRRKRGTKYSAQSTFKAASGSSIVKKPKKSNLIERYKQKQLSLLETVKKLQDPKQHDNMALLRNANECIEVMVEATQIINSPPSVIEKGG